MYLSKTVPGSLMAEHQLILRMIADLRLETERIGGGGEVDPAYIDVAVDFLRSYADRCHHGKEEDILFRDLGQRALDPDDARAMQELVDDHIWARGTTRKLVAANARHAEGDMAARDEVVKGLADLAGFYPVHIEKEDHGFFRAAMEYLSPEERTAMAEEFSAFDRALIHERYLRIVDEVTASRIG